MSFISVFDVLGPNMIGPSSSHTAGAARIAYLAQKMIAGPLVRVEFILYGSFARTYRGHGTDRALLGGIMGFDTDDEDIEIANNSVFGLSSCVFSRDQKRAFKVAAAMEAGGAVINGASFFRSFEMPFGGWKHSGIGTEGVLSTFNEMTRVKTIVLKNVL